MAAPRPSHSGKALRRRVTSTLLGIDVMFKLLCVPAIVSLTRGVSCVQIVASLAIGCLGWMGAVAYLLRPVVRWLDATGPASDGVALSAVMRVRSLAVHTALVYTAGWWIPVLVIAAWSHSLSLPTVLFICAIALGPLPLGYVIADRTISQVREALAIESRRVGIYVTTRAGTLRQRIVVLCVCLGLAPGLYIASIATSAQMHAMTFHDLTLLLGLGGLGSVLYIVVCSTLFGGLLARPITHMTDVASTIALRGNTTRIGRLPLEHDDEIGQLAGWTNRMLDRLEQVDADRASARASLEALNRSLEQRVDERTARLAEANAALETEMQSRIAMEAELRQAQKLEAIGRLAAGVAHEINSPIQYVTDSLRFIEEANTDLRAVLPYQVNLIEKALECAHCRPVAEVLQEKSEAADMEFLTAETPPAFARAKDGLMRVATIVRSMNQFAHADRDEMLSVELNSSIASTLAIANNEYKYVAELETDFEELPLVTCYGGEINQVVLNLVVNAAHAISDAVQGTDKRGKITVRTRSTTRNITVSISDTGGGIPDAIGDRIFDPFFTTKEVGHGTGQGLALARAVVQRHQGSLEYESLAGVGTTFHLRIPIHPAATSCD
ncbi:MAG TPA: ATP-binding protein [Kofleriaceae bacterium]|jgi:signal transduction histidine kinase